uniref:RNase_PH domain-containing protein n=1 Tax=Syphacia muris TaxID=451379 RepID=A0A0N5ASU6_9BILA
MVKMLYVERTLVELELCGTNLALLKRPESTTLLPLDTTGVLCDAIGGGLIDGAGEVLAAACTALLQDDPLCELEQSNTEERSQFGECPLKAYGLKKSPVANTTKN